MDKELAKQQWSLDRTKVQQRTNIHSTTAQADQRCQYRLQEYQLFPLGPPAAECQSQQSNILILIDSVFDAATSCLFDLPRKCYYFSIVDSFVAGKLAECHSGALNLHRDQSDGAPLVLGAADVIGYNYEDVGTACGRPGQARAARMHLGLVTQAPGFKHTKLQVGKLTYTGDSIRNKKGWAGRFESLHVKCLLAGSSSRQSSYCQHSWYAKQTQLTANCTVVSLVAAAARQSQSWFQHQPMLSGVVGNRLEHSQLPARRKHPTDTSFD